MELMPLLTHPAFLALQVAGIPAGYVYGVVMEWVVHNLLYHQLAMRVGAPIDFHLKDHHRATSVGRGVDPSFARRGIRWDARGREVGGLLLLLVLHAPAAVVAPLFYVTLLVHSARCVVSLREPAPLSSPCPAPGRTGSLRRVAAIHTRAHRDPDWCREHLPWHSDRPSSRRAA